MPQQCWCKGFYRDQRSYSMARDAAAALLLMLLQYCGARSSPPMLVRYARFRQAQKLKRADKQQRQKVEPDCRRS